MWKHVPLLDADNDDLGRCPLDVESALDLLLAGDLREYLHRHRPLTGSPTLLIEDYPEDLSESLGGSRGGPYGPALTRPGPVETFLNNGGQPTTPTRGPDPGRSPSPWRGEGSRKRTLVRTPRGFKFWPLVAEGVVRSPRTHVDNFSPEVH